MKKSLQLLIGLSIAGAALWYTLRNVALADVWHSFGTVGWVHIIPTLILCGLTYVCRCWRWKTLVQPLCPDHKVKMADLYSPLMIGFLAAILPARAGEFIRAYLLGKKQNLSFASAFATIVVERLFDLITLILLLGWLLVFHAELFAGGASFEGITVKDLAFTFGLISMGMVAGLMVFIYLLTFYYDRAIKLVQWCIRPLPENWGYKIVQLVETFSQGLSVIRSPSALVSIAWASILVWTFIVFTNYPLYWAYDLQDKSVTSLITLNLMICILITVAPTPAYLGSFNAGILIALHEIMGEAEVSAVSFGFVAWGLNFGLVIVGGLYFILRDSISFSKLTEIDSEKPGTP